jgi:uncharacterized NAD-dependent epimerase/dehydratase family protein
MTKAEKARLNAVAELPCAVCGLECVQVHHIRTGVGMGRRSSHFDTIPLCHRHHIGSDGIHHLGRRAWEAMIDRTELELLSETNQKLAR